MSMDEELRRRLDQMQRATWDRLMFGDGYTVARPQPAPSNPLEDIRAAIRAMPDPLAKLTKELGFRPYGIIAHSIAYRSAKGHEIAASKGDFLGPDYSQRLMGLPVLLFDWVPKDSIIFAEETVWTLIQGIDKHNFYRKMLAERIARHVKTLETETNRHKRRDLYKRVGRLGSLMIEHFDAQEAGTRALSNLLASAGREREG
jgi:hypothetical protein